MCIIIMNKTVRFIHISDTHLRDDPSAKMYGVNVYDAALKAVEAINSSTLPFDFVVHTGDVASVDGTQKEYELATKIFENIKVPMYFLTGNHDDAQLMRQILKFGEKKDLSADDTRLFYSFKIADHNFLVLDAKTTKEEDPHGRLPQEQLDRLDGIIAEAQGYITIFIHYPVVSPDSAWLKRSMTILNADAILKIFNKYSSKISGVFSGHIHQGTVLTQNGIVYSSAGSTFLNFRNAPNDEDVIFLSNGVGYFSHVTINGPSIEIKQYAFENGVSSFIKTREEMLKSI